MREVVDDAMKRAQIEMVELTMKVTHEGLGPRMTVAKFELDERRFRTSEMMNNIE